MNVTHTPDWHKPVTAPTEDDLLRLFIRYAGPSSLYLVADNLRNFGLAFNMTRSPPPSEFMKPPPSTPFTRLPAEVVNQVLAQLPKADLASLCAVSKDFSSRIRPHLYREVSSNKWPTFLRLARSLTAKDGPAWRAKAVSSCRSISVVSSCGQDLIGHSDKCRSHRPMLEGSFITEQVEEAIVALAKHSGRIESVSWRFCHDTSPGPALFNELNQHPLRRLSLDDTCHPLTMTCIKAGRAPGIQLMQLPGWSHLVVLDSLRSLELISIVHGEPGKPPISKPLNRLLAGCPSLEELHIELGPSKSHSLDCAVLTDLDRLNFSRLHKLDLTAVAAPSSASLASFLNRHSDIVDLRWRGPFAHITTEAIQTASRAASTDPDRINLVDGSITTLPGDAIHLPKLRTLDVSSGTLLSSILALSRPETVHNVFIDMIESISEAQLQDLAHVTDPSRFLAAIEENMRSACPLSALSQCTSIVEMSVVFRRHPSAPGWQAHVANAFSQLPTSLSILTIYTASADEEKPMPKEVMPLTLPLDCLRHLQNLRLLALPSHCLLLEDKDVVNAETPKLDRPTQLARTAKRKADVKRRFDVICRRLADMMPLLDSIYFIGTGTLDHCDAPAWRLCLIWEGALWSPFQAFFATIVRKSPPPPPTPFEMQRRSDFSSRLGGWLLVLSTMPSVRYRHAQLEKQRVNKLLKFKQRFGRLGPGMKLPKGAEAAAAESKKDKAGGASTSVGGSEDVFDFEIVEFASPCLCTSCFGAEMVAWPEGSCLEGPTQEQLAPDEEYPLTPDMMWQFIVTEDG